MADAPAGGGAKGQVLEPGKQALFSICGLYMIYWLWLRSQELNNYLGREAIKPLFVIVGLICGPVMFYVDWLLVNAVHEAQEKAGLSPKDEKVMDIVWFLICWPLGIKRIQEKLNAVWEK